MEVAIIADDLTGAADSGVQLACAGYRTAVAFWGAPVPPEGNLDAVAVDTDSRTMPPGFAAKRVVEAGRAVRGANVVYKKIDSTLRGPVAAELAAALGATGRERVVVAPAFPAAGRTTVGGVQLVRGVPVHETEAKDDPHTPVREGHVPTLLANALHSVSTLGTGELADPGRVRSKLKEARCVVVDAERDEDLRALARALPDPSAVLWAGSAGLALALGGAYPGPHAGAPDGNPPSRRVLVAIGSLSGASREQLGRLVGEHGEAAALEVGTSVEANGLIARARAALEGAGCAVIHSAAEIAPSGDVGHPVGALAEAAAGLSKEGLFDALVLTGGATALGVARRLGATGIRLEGELEPGVPVGTLIGPRRYRVVTKAGGFGGPETLVNAVEALLRGGKG